MAVTTTSLSGLGTNSISGLSSGFDWQSMITQLMQVEHRRVDLVTAKQTDDENRLKEWQSFNTKLLALKTAADGLKDPESFNLFTSSMTTDSSTVEAADLLSVSASSSAAKGSYNIKISSLAQAQKLSSNSFSSLSDALGSAYAGDILINGKTVNISATDDLTDLRNKINNLNSGTNPTHVTASIISYGTTDYRLILTSDATGADGISLLNASSTDILGNLGLTETAAGSYEVKNGITGGAQSDRFVSVSGSIKSLLGLNSAPSSTTLLKIKDSSGNTSDAISINLATDDLYTIRDAINSSKGAADISASVVSETENGITYYRLQVDGINATDPFADENNVFQTLGLIRGGVGDVLGVKGTVANTKDGQVLTADTLLTDIDGYRGWTSGDKIDFSGQDTSGNPVSSSFTITSSSTVQDLLDAIETAYGNVTASVTGDGKIQIIDNQTTSESSSLNVTLTETVANGSLDFGTFGAAATLRKREIIAGQDAVMTVDGVEVTRSKNNIDDVITGVTLNLLKADTDTTITLNLGMDYDRIVNSISGFVDSYNTVASYIHDQQSYDTDKQQTGGILFGDGTLSSVKSDITSLLVEKVWGVSSDFSTLGLVGINLDNDGKLSISTDKLKSYLQSNFNDVKNLFAAAGTVSTGTLQYVSHSNDSHAGEYTVHITNAATRSTTASDNAITGTLGGSEDLTITEGSKTATIHLTDGMTKTDIINAVNTELDAVYTETLVGADSLYADAEETTKIDSATKWNSVFKSGGLSANLVNGDIISFEGTDRSGESISGSYRITDVSTDTVQGLLSAIETAYGNTVAATINSSGQIMLTDKSSGSSQLSLTFDYSEAHDLNFGSVSVDNPGGLEGRYAMDMTASVDDTDHIVLTHNSYGSAYNFTVSESSNLLWTGTPTVTAGEDVAGTINGEAATGAGQTLTGNSGDANVDGLVIKYTGSDEGVDAGTVKLTLGIGELFSRSLFNMTDSLEGYVAFKQTSLQNEIDGYKTQVEQMEALLSKKQETMTNRFVAMELALSKIQSQSSWLTSQLNTISNSWTI